MFLFTTVFKTKTSFHLLYMAIYIFLELTLITLPQNLINCTGPKYLCNNIHKTNHYFEAKFIELLYLRRALL